MNDTDGAGGPGKRMATRSLAVAAVSTVVEWYDFTVYLYLATVLSRVFFGGGTASLIVTLAGFAVAYALRPLGAIVFGHFGDRHGRRATMMASMALMTAALLVTALLPTRAQIGPAAGWLLLAVRAITAFSVGGEYTGVVAYLIEGAPPHRRGLVTSAASTASEVGGLLAAGAAALAVGMMTPAQLDDWGWRLPFLFGAALAGAILVARSSLEETPEFTRQQAAGAIPRNPLAHVVAHHRAAIARGFAISALGSISYYVGIVYVPVFLSSTGAMGEGGSLMLATLAAVVVIGVTPLTGWLADRLGRKPVLLVAAGGCVVLPVSMFALMAGGVPARVLAGAVVLAWLGGAVSAVGAVATAEQFPGEGRLSGLALGATTATAIFGGLTPLVAQLLVARTGSAMVPGVMIAVVALCVLPVLATMRETRPASASAR